MNTSDMNTAETIKDIEGFLLWEAEKHTAHARARAFCSRMPWLTDSQRQEVERLYAQDHLGVSRGFLERVVERSGELRAEYEHRYRTLRSRLLAAALLGAAVLAGVVAVAVALP
ncbi:hypothetical protein [Streptomyces sp. XD-27]|uniref:hypothetical protein n=1 Tax=Streptomyces sp. XD-27 TaxID=3062779 RepID=UPI0026F41ABA|nr:hypothetical protein [Streptomyces sp. XD-27]WKX69069.1 hypothetical protein Q3Y56_03310 [Streptomyces sp. XD-27]